MYRNSVAYSAMIVIGFILVILTVSVHGYRSRSIANESMVLAIDTPEQAYEIWRGKMVRGRVLLLFDNYPHMKGLHSYDRAPELSRSNLIEFSIFKNIVRKMYLIVPDDQWAAFEQRAAVNPIRDIDDMEKGMYLDCLSGIPFIATTPSSLPELTEKVLVYVNHDVFNLKLVQELLSHKNISSDILIVYQSDRR